MYLESKRAPAVRACGLTKRFGRAVALDGLDFSVAAGQVVGLLGRNGAGKSTLLRIVSGQLRQTGGEAELTGFPVGGVCPFAVKEGVKVYLDESLKRFETVFPAAGSANSAAK